MPGYFTLSLTLMSWQKNSPCQGRKSLNVINKTSFWVRLQCQSTGNICQLSRDIFYYTYYWISKEKQEKGKRRMVIRYAFLFGTIGWSLCKACPIFSPQKVSRNAVLLLFEHPSIFCSAIIIYRIFYFLYTICIFWDGGRGVWYGWIGSISEGEAIRTIPS